METIIEKKIIKDFSKRLNLNENQIKLFIFMAEMNGDPNATHAVFGRRWNIEINEALSIVKNLSDYFNPIAGQYNSAETYPDPTDLGKLNIKLISERIKEFKEEIISDQISKAGNKIMWATNTIGALGLILLFWQGCSNYHSYKISKKQYKLEHLKYNQILRSEQNNKSSQHHQDRTSCSCDCKK
jgi:hypothetical protein